MGTISEEAAILRQQWETDPRWTGIERTYSAEDVIRLRGSVAEEHALAWLGATRLWDLLHTRDVTREPAARMAEGGPRAVGRINKAMLRADPVSRPEPAEPTWPVPVVADAEAGSSGVLNAFDLMTAMIEAGAAGVHFEDRLPAEKTGGAVLIPTAQHVKTLNAARLAADVLDVPALVIARTAATTGNLLAPDTDERDDDLLTGEQTAEGFYRVWPGLYACVTRALSFAPYADLLWLEAPAPDLAEARAFAQIIHSRHPGKPLAYSCPPSPDADMVKFREELAALGYRFQPAGDPRGHGAAREQREADIRYFDRVTRAIAPEQDAAPLAESLEPAHFVGDDQVDHHGRLVPSD